MLQNEYLLGSIGFDTAKNETKVCYKALTPDSYNAWISHVQPRRNFSSSQGFKSSGASETTAEKKKATSKNSRSARRHILFSAGSEYAKFVHLKE